MAQSLSDNTKTLANPIHLQGFVVIFEPFERKKTFCSISKMLKPELFWTNELKFVVIYLLFNAFDCLLVRYLLLCVLLLHLFAWYLLLLVYVLMHYPLFSLAIVLDLAVQ